MSLSQFIKAGRQARHHTTRQAPRRIANDDCDPANQFSLLTMAVSRPVDVTLLFGCRAFPSAKLLYQLSYIWSENAFEFLDMPDMPVGILIPVVFIEAIAIM